MLEQPLRIEPRFPIHVGRCIYCGRHDLKLSDEHVVPYALHGTWRLLKASCGEHRDYTSALEGDLLHRAWGTGRGVLKLRTRRKRDRPTAFPIRVEQDGQVRDIPVPTGQHPGPLVFLEYAPPGVTPAHPLIAGTPVLKRRMFRIDDRLWQFSAQHGVRAIRLPHPDPLKFAKVLAKIAYAFAVGCFGLDGVIGTPLLSALLANGRDIFAFVGNDPRLGNHTDATGTYSIAIKAGLDGRVAFVRLLGAIGAPEYVVRIDSPGTG